MPASSSPENIGRLRRATTGGAREALTAAVLAGLIRWPRQLVRHAERLAGSPGLDPRFAALLDCCDAAQVVESGDLSTILIGHGVAIPAPGEYSHIRFPFLEEGADETFASEALDVAIAKLIEEPTLDKAIEEATARFDFEEQQRLRMRKESINTRMKQLTSQISGD